MRTKGSSNHLVCTRQPHLAHKLLVRTNQGISTCATKIIFVALEEVIIADSSTTSLWEDDIGSLAVRSSYLLKKFHVRDYGSKKFIFKAREDSEILAISMT